MKIINLNYYSAKKNILIFFHKASPSATVSLSRVSSVSNSPALKIASHLYNLKLDPLIDEYVWKEGNTILKTHYRNISNFCPTHLFQQFDETDCDLVWFYNSVYLPHIIALRSGSFRLAENGLVYHRGSVMRFYNQGTYQNIVSCNDKLHVCEEEVTVDNDVTSKQTVIVQTDRNTLHVNLANSVLKSITCFNMFLSLGTDLVSQVQTNETNHTFLQLNYSQSYTVLITDTNFDVIGDLLNIIIPPGVSDKAQPFHSQDFQTLSSHSCTVTFSNIIWYNQTRLIKVSNKTEQLGVSNNHTFNNLQPNRRHIINISLCNTVTACNDADPEDNKLSVQCYTNITTSPEINIISVTSSSVTITTTTSPYMAVSLSLMKGLEEQGELYPTTATFTIPNLQGLTKYCITARYYYNATPVVSDCFTKVCVTTKDGVIKWVVLAGAVVLVIMVGVGLVGFKVLLPSKKKKVGICLKFLD